jgi:ribosomal protein L18
MYLQATELCGKTIISLCSRSYTRAYNETSSFVLAEVLGKSMAYALITRGICNAFFNRRNFKFHGKMKVCLESMKSEGLNI